MSSLRPEGRPVCGLIWISFVLAGLMILADLGCNRSDSNAAGAQNPTSLPVKIQVAALRPIEVTTEYVATLKSRDSAVVMPQVEGIITQIYVHSGDHVSADTPLLQIDPSKQQATVKSQEDTHGAKLAELQWDRQQYDRISKLYAAGVVSKQDLDQAQSALDNARAQLSALDAQVNEQRVQLHYYRVTAGASGMVGDIPVRVGDRVTTSTMLTTVDKPGNLEAYICVPVERSAQLKMNMPVQLVDAEEHVMAESRVSFISPQVDTATQTVLMKAAISNHKEKLRTAQFIRARIVWDSRPVPVIPVLAVSRIGGQYFAFVAEDQGGKTLAHQKPLKVGEMVGNDYVVLEGLKPGDKIIVSGTQFLIDGMPVAPQG